MECAQVGGHLTLGSHFRKKKQLLLDEHRIIVGGSLMTKQWHILKNLKKCVAFTKSAKYFNFSFSDTANYMI